MENMKQIDSMNTVRTEVAESLGRRGVSFTRPDAWATIEEHVSTHKYLLDVRTRANVALESAADSWMSSVAAPLLDALNTHHAIEAFPERRIGDLLIEISDHWYFLKQETPDATPAQAVESYTMRYGSVSASGRPHLVGRAVSAIRDAIERSRQIDSAVKERREQYEVIQLF